MGSRSDITLRLGRALVRWEPWPTVLLHGVGGLYFFARTLIWNDTDSIFEFWARIGLATMMVTIAAVSLWDHFASESQPPA